MTLQAKSKMCSCCGTLQKLWKANPPMCKNCYGRNKQGENDNSLWMEKEEAKESVDFMNRADMNLIRNPSHFRKSTLKTKPKPTVNGRLLHTALYMSCFGYGDTDFIPSELSGIRCVDVHHIQARSMGGTKKEDRIENLIGLTRLEHEKYGDKKHCMSFLFERHRDFMLLSGVKFDMNWIEEQITKWKDDERK